MDTGTHVSIGDESNGGESRRRQDNAPMTASQAAQLKNLAAEAGVPVDLTMNRRDAAKKIDELQRRQARGNAGDA